MKLDLDEDAQEFGRTARRALAAAGGDRLVQMAESDPARGASAVESVLGGLGAWQLDPRTSVEEMEAAAALCRGAGYWGVPYPVAERICRPRDLEADGAVVVADVNPSARITGVPGRWVAITVDGRRAEAAVRPTPAPARKTALVVPLDLTPLDRVSAAEVALGLTLTCWTLLGMLDRALESTCRYVLDRKQFGQALASFQGVQFQLTEAEVERAGLEELAGYALWSLEMGSDRALEDALGLRLAALEAADVVFRVAHQLHGAIGFCDETTISWLSRYSAPLRRLPYGVSGTRAHLTRRVSPRGLSGLFG